MKIVEIIDFSVTPIIPIFFFNKTTQSIFDKFHCFAKKHLSKVFFL